MEEFELEPGESVIATVRKHSVVFALQLLPYLLILFLPFAFALAVYLLESNVPGVDALVTGDLSLANPYVRLFLGLWWLLTWTTAFNTFTKYYLDLWIITTERIVNIHQRGFFRREVASFLLEHVQDVTTDIEGVIPTIAGFGTVRVETAGTESRHFLMSGLRNPQKVRDIIMREIAMLHARMPTHHDEVSP